MSAAASSATSNASKMVATMNQLKSLKTVGPQLAASGDVAATDAMLASAEASWAQMTKLLESSTMADFRSLPEGAFGSTAATTPDDVKKFAAKICRNCSKHMDHVLIRCKKAGCDAVYCKSGCQSKDKAAHKKVCPLKIK